MWKAPPYENFTKEFCAEAIPKKMGMKFRMGYESEKLAFQSINLSSFLKGFNGFCHLTMHFT